MMTIDELRAALQDRKAKIVAAATGVHENTVRDIASGRNDNPTYRVMLSLSDYLRSGKKNDAS